MTAEKIEIYFNELLDTGIRFVPRLALAILGLVIGFWVIGWFSRFVRKGLERRQIDSTLRTFIKSAVSIGLKIMLIIMIAGMLGVHTSSFVAVIGAMGLAIGLALQGSLSNFAGGFLIILFKPYEVGDFVELEGKSGTVKEIQLFNTVLLTPDGLTIIIPNGQTSNHTIVNITRHGIRRAEITLLFPIEAEIGVIRALVMTLVQQDSRVLDTPAPEFLLMKIGPGDITTVVRFHTINDDYWDAYHGIQEGLLHLLRERKILFDDDAERVLISVEKRTH